jgi:hypothetical protein
MGLFISGYGGYLKQGEQIYVGDRWSEYGDKDTNGGKRKVIDSNEYKE